MSIRESPLMPKRWRWGKRGKFSPSVMSSAGYKGVAAALQGAVTEMNNAVPLAPCFSTSIFLRPALSSAPEALGGPLQNALTLALGTPMDKRLSIDRFVHVEVTNLTQLRNWLAAHYSQHESVWLATFKKDTPEKYVSRQQVLDELLCFGWIDGVLRTLDDKRTMQLISPRRHQVWAKSYKDRAERLIAEGRMERPGLVAIETSKSGGFWDAMNEVDALEVPEDLAIALSATSTAASRFDACAPSYRRNVLRWIAIAKTDVTRNKRISTVAAFAERGEKVPQM
jgi:uncharacterized protein YdeI (YjbR/CyaY-like superfamily)